MTVAIKIRKGDSVVDGRGVDLESCIVKSIGDGSDNRFLVLASLGTEDRDQDTIDSKGWMLDYFNNHPVLVDSHNYEGITHQIGKWADLDTSKNSLRGVTEIYAGAGNPIADWAAVLAHKGDAAFSVGFIDVEKEPRKSGGWHYTKQELLEISQVIVPSNRQALQLMAKGVTVPADSMQAKLARKMLTDMPAEQRRPRQKWAIDDDAMLYGGPDTRHCIVAGCDDASQLMIPICSEHLKVLMASDPEPAGSPPDDDAGITMGLSELGRILKAGKPLSGANLGKLHTAMQSLKDVHATAGAHDDCPLADDSTDGPATERDKAVDPPAKAYDLGAVIEAQLSAALEARAW